MVTGVQTCALPILEHLRLPYDEVQTSDLAEVVDKGMDEVISKGVRNFIVDDSGLFVDALKGFPGVWSAYAQKTIGNKGILKLMEGVEDRGAEFRCCIGCDIEGQRIIVTGICRGTITESETGDGGFPTGINVKGRCIRKGIMHAFFYMFAMCIQIR